MIDEYLKLLGLDRANLTEESVKRAYHKKAREFHPDNIKGSGLSKEEAEEKFKKINEAAEALRKYLRVGKYTSNQSTSSTYTNNDYVDVRRYRAKELNRIAKLIEGVEELKYDLDEYNRKINQIIINISNLKNKSEIDELLSQFDEEYVKMLQYIKREFFKENFISDIKEEKINYKLSVKEFMKHLESLKVKYSKSYLFSAKLEDKIEEFKGWAYYDSLKSVISDYRNAHYQRARNVFFENTEGIIDDLRVAINMLFDDYTKVCIRVNELLEKCKSIFGEDIISTVRNNKVVGREFTLVRRILSIKENYNGIKDNTNQLLDELSQELVKEEEFKNKVSELKEANLEIAKRYKDALTRDKGNKDLICNHKHIYDLYEQIYNAAINRRIDVDICRQLKDLSFTDYDADINLISRQVLRIKGADILIAKESSIQLRPEMQRVIMAFPNKKILYKNGIHSTFEGTLSWDGKRSYMSLDNLLNECSFKGITVKCVNDDERYFVLYTLRNSACALVIRENGLIDFVNIGICKLDSDNDLNFDKEQALDIEGLKRFIARQMLDYIQVGRVYSPDSVLGTGYNSDDTGKLHSDFEIKISDLKLYYKLMPEIKVSDLLEEFINNEEEPIIIDNYKDLNLKKKKRM